MKPLEITEEQRMILLNSLHNRSDMLKNMMEIYAREGSDNDVVRCIDERVKIRELRRLIRAL